jgi:hypothetical protein
MNQLLLLLATVYKMRTEADPGSWADRLPAGIFTLSYAR